jgi:hypothetical protein
MSRKQRSKSKYNHTRRPLNLPLRESFIIFCEGETEVGYFSSFEKRARFTSGGNALKVVENAVAFKNANEKKYDHYWVVFDKDETTDQHFTQAIQLAETNDIRAAWSNQAFECWIVMHYREFKHTCHRNEYEILLKQYIPGYNTREKGEEQGRKLHLLTVPLLPGAIERAKNGYASFDKALPAAQKQTSTLIYELVESILARG